MAPSSSANTCRLPTDRLLLLLLALLGSLSLLLSVVRLRYASLASTDEASAQPTHREWPSLGAFRHANGQPTRQSLRSNAPPTPTENCSPRLVDAHAVAYLLPHKFNELLQALEPPFEAPVMARKHAYLCDPSGRERLNREWSYCLPITGRHDLPYCAAPDRLDLLVPLSPKTLCYSSVLHLLLVDVYAELQRHGARPVLLFGSLLGAVRNASLIPFTEDADLGYVYSASLRMKHVKQALWEKGYHLFREGVLRVCVAPTHPLAGNLYDRRRDSQRRSCHVPYVDLYKMQLHDNRLEWEVEETRNKRRVPRDKFEPYSTVRVNDMEFDTLADPVDFLEHEYGVQWRTPKKRGTYRVIDAGNDTNLPEGPMPRLPRAPNPYDLEDGEFDSAVDYDMPEFEDIDAGELEGQSAASRGVGIER